MVLRCGGAISLTHILLESSYRVLGMKNISRNETTSVHLESPGVGMETEVLIALFGLRQCL